MPARWQARHQVGVRCTHGRLSTSTALTTARSSYTTHTTSTHQFLSVGQTLQAAAGAASTTTPPIAAATAAGLTFTLPPLCLWGASSQEVSVEGSTHVSRRMGGSSTGTRYAGVWSPLETYLAQLSTAGTSPPAFVVLRLFPDLTIAQLPTTFLDTAVGEAAEEEAGQAAAPAHVGQSSRLRRRRRRTAAPHEQPLEAILCTEEPWGSGADTQLTFKHAVEGLREMGERLLPQLPLVLQLPTRLLVSQQFLEDMATTLVRCGWRSVAFELPSTQQLYSPFQARLPQSGDGVGGGLSGSRGGRWAGGTAVLPSGGNSDDWGAVDAGWCRLPLLCTPWPVLCRHPTLGPSLRRLRRRDVVPFHVLVTWALQEARLFDGVEQGVVVDVAAPVPGAARRQAEVESPAAVGVSQGEGQRLAAAAVVQTQSAGRHYSSSVEAAAEDDAAVAASEEHKSQLKAPRLTVYMGEDPTASHGAGVGLSAGVMQAVRQHQSTTAAAARGTADQHSGAPSNSADLAKAEAAWRRAQADMLPSPRHPAAPSAAADDTSPFILDTPPDHLRALIQQSIVSHDSGAPSSSPAPTPRQQLLQKVGLFMQHTLSQDAAEATSAEQQGDKEEEEEEEAALEREAAELEMLLLEANNATAAANVDVEHMTREVQRYMKAHAQSSGGNSSSSAAASSASAAHSDAEGMSAARQSGWLRCTGYWACLHVLLHGTTQARLLWTLPTYNAAAVQAWSEAYAACVPLSGRERGGSVPPLPPADCAVHLPVVPVWMPLQPVMHTEVARLLREGRAFPQPHSFSSSSADSTTSSLVESTEAYCAWLPTCLNAALLEALGQLPMAYQAAARRRLLRGQRLLREGGAQAARRGGCVIDKGAGAAATASNQSDGAEREEEGEEKGAARGGHADGSSDAEDDDADGGVHIRLRRGAPLLFLLSPSQVARMEEEEGRTTAAAAASRAAGTSSPPGDTAKALQARVQDADDALLASVTDYYASAAVARQRAGRPSSMYVPTPGMEASLLSRSWRLMS